ncbi:META domain-containing protein [Spirosoma rigui]|uniref:META domain-containing protein n=1 Tax=Spirosoma rigui TaxID=564064 RepID=UPI0009B062B2|nr:META domain-containing protein [Spirosoma rigui]
MRNIIVAAFVILLLTQCGEDKREVAPGVARLVGTWRLAAPDSSYATTLIFALDTANPPKDIIHFSASGKAAVNTYDAFLSAAVDGLMVFTSVGSTKLAGSPQALQFEQTYFTSLSDVVRFELPTDNRLRLYHGGEKGGLLEYIRVK